jgi:hypothetical protein
LALYKGLGAVLSGIIPKMAIRFASFEAYKGWLSNKETGKTSVGSIFIGANFSCQHIATLIEAIHNSWSGGRNNGSRGSCNSNGGC